MPTAPTVSSIPVRKSGAWVDANRLAPARKQTAPHTTATAATTTHRQAGDAVDANATAAPITVTSSAAISTLTDTAAPNAVRPAAESVVRNTNSTVPRQNTATKAHVSGVSRRPLSTPSTVAATGLIGTTSRK